MNNLILRNTAMLLCNRLILHFNSRSTVPANELGYCTEYSVLRAHSHYLILSSSRPALCPANSKTSMTLK